MARTLDFSNLSAVLLDVDGTLYDQRPLRFRMLGELLRLPLSQGIGRARRTWRAISAFRKTLEGLRELPPGSNIAAHRYARAAARAGIDEGELREIVEEWMFSRPLRWIERSARPGMREFVEWMAGTGRRVGVLSDYASSRKLEALGIDRTVKLRLCCDDADIDAFKPHPHGFLRASTIWQLPPIKVLYVGDRPSVDAMGAKAAGMPCAILGKSGLGRSFVGVRSFAELRERLERTG